MPDIGSTTSPRWFSEALIIAGAPALLYLLTLAYECMFVTYFGVPFSFISVSWIDMFVVGFTLFVITNGVFLFVLLGAVLWPSNKKRLSYVRAIDAFPAVLVALQILYYFWERPHRWLTVLPPVFCIIVGVLTGLFIRREHKSCGIDPAILARRKFFVTVFVWVQAGLVTSLIAGTLHAKLQTQFFVTSNSPQTVVLGIWGDTVVTARFDRNTRTVKEDFTIIKISDHSPLNIRAEKVGPLRLEKEDE